MSAAEQQIDAGSASELTIRSVTGTLVVVPMRRPLGTSALRVTEAPLLLIDLETEQGIVGRSYVFCYLESIGRATAELVHGASEVLRGSPAAPAVARRKLLGHFKLPGVRGITATAIAAIDVACWDALALAAGLPLARLLGSASVPIPAYNSNGLGLIGPREAADEAQALAAEGFGAVKMRLGRATGREDLTAVRAVRDALDPGIAVMADFNQALTPAAAFDRCRMLDDEGLYWIEEPVRHDDYHTMSALAAELRTPLQLGENFSSPRAMAGALDAGAGDFVMPDLDRIGGVTGWITAAGLSADAEVPMSSHLFHEVSSHLLAASPTAHWIEYVDWADPILGEPLRPTNGRIAAPERPGNGLTWDPDAVARYRRGVRSAE